MFRDLSLRVFGGTLRARVVEVAAPSLLADVSKTYGVIENGKFRRIKGQREYRQTPMTGEAEFYFPGLFRRPIVIYL